MSFIPCHLAHAFITITTFLFRKPLLSMISGRCDMFFFFANHNLAWLWDVQDPHVILQTLIFVGGWSQHHDTFCKCIFHLLFMCSLHRLHKKLILVYKWSILVCCKWKKKFMIHVLVFMCRVMASGQRYLDLEVLGLWRMWLDACEAMECLHYNCKKLTTMEDNSTKKKKGEKCKRKRMGHRRGHAHFPLGCLYCFI